MLIPWPRETIETSYRLAQALHETFETENLAILLPIVERGLDRRLAAWAAHDLDGGHDAAFLAEAKSIAALMHLRSLFTFHAIAQHYLEISEGDPPDRQLAVEAIVDAAFAFGEAHQDWAAATTELVSTFWGNGAF